jgi:hypothetical protein
MSSLPRRNASGKHRPYILAVVLRDPFRHLPVTCIHPLTIPHDGSRTRWKILITARAQRLWLCFASDSASDRIAARNCGVALTGKVHPSGEQKNGG